MVTAVKKFYEICPRQSGRTFHIGLGQKKLKKVEFSFYFEISAFLIYYFQTFLNGGGGSG
jgi:hypothetical protein